MATTSVLDRVATSAASAIEVATEPAMPPGGRTMYAISFDLDTKELAAQWDGNSPNYAYAAIGNFLKQRGFEWKQGSVYFGDTTVDPVKAVLAVQELATRYPWFNEGVVRDIRMLRIEENNDLNPVLAYVKEQQPTPTLPLDGLN